MMNYREEILKLLQRVKSEYHLKLIYRFIKGLLD